MSQTTTRRRRSTPAIIRRAVPALRRRSTPRRFYKIRRRMKKGPVPILPVLTGVVGPIASALSREGNVLYNFQVDPAGAALGVANQLSRQYTGFSIRGEPFNWSYPLQTYGGLLVGVFGHWLANKSGLNRTMKKIPYLGKYVNF